MMSIEALPVLRQHAAYAYIHMQHQHEQHQLASSVVRSEVAETAENREEQNISTCETAKSTY
jgi:hypothetical protein